MNAIILTQAEGVFRGRISDIFDRLSTPFEIIAHPEALARAGLDAGSIVVSIGNAFIVPDAARFDGVNFHFGAPSFRGVGGYVDVVANRRPFHSVTVHQMDDRIDAGRIIHHQQFAISGLDFNSLRGRTELNACIALEYVLRYRLANGEWPRSPEVWAGPLHTRTELLAILDGAGASLGPDLLAFYLGTGKARGFLDDV